MMVQTKSDMNSVKGFELSVIREYVNNKLAEYNSSEQMNNREVEVRLQEHFGNRVTFLYFHRSNKSLMCFASYACSAQTLAETIWNTDHVKKGTNKLRNCLLEYYYGLKDRFYDGSDLRIAWDNTHVPKPVLDFLKVLFSADSSHGCSDAKLK